MSSNKPHVAIIILNWNGLQDTMECLISVFKNDYPNYSIYLIDNHSDKDELKQIKEWVNKELGNDKEKPKINYLQSDRNLGFSGGNNLGIRQALERGADYIFTLNNDTEVDSRFLKEAVETISKTPSTESEDRHPRLPKSTKSEDDHLRLQKRGTPSSPSEGKIGIVATTMINYYDRTMLDNTGHIVLSTGDTFPRERNLKIQNSKFKTANLKSSPMGACAGAALYSAKMLRDIGLFDTDFFLNYEDSDLSLRAIVQGWSIVYSPKSIVYHKISASIGKIKDSKYRIRSQRNMIWAYLHNTPLLVIFLNSPLFLLRDLVVILLSIITFRWGITWIFIRSRIEVLRTLPKTLRKRRKVLKNQKVSSWWWWWRQENFLKTYWGYFRDIVLKGHNSVMD